jgi:hypothetical protein
VNTFQLPREQVTALRAEDLQLYLQSRGWNPDDNASSGLATVYRLPGEPDAEILVPKRRDLGDYVLRMADAVMMLSAVEQRSVWEVMVDLASPPTDVVRLRLQSPDAASGTVALEEGLHLIQGGRDLLLAAACSAHQPQAYFPRPSYAPASEFLRNCRLGQTEQGGFVARIITPVPPAISPGLVAENGENEIPTGEPYERRVTLYLMAGLRAIEAAIAEGRPEKILQGVRQGVSANLCDALVTMTPSNPQASLEVSLAWSRARPPVPKRLRGPVAFAQGQFAVIREAGRRLREGAEPRRERIVGVVINLQADPPQLLNPFEGRVIVRALVEGRSNRVRFMLPQGDYARACDAHRDRRRISVTGVLQRDARSRMFDLLQPHDFQVLQDSPTPVG